ncbi:MAG: hypothetical protein OEY41_16255 [Acidimicrobiia bacterium]|nr:hypothetical protein [Acidimicrobiia bacterium]
MGGAPAGFGPLTFTGKTGGSPLEGDSGYLRGQAALATLARNRFVQVEQTVSQVRIRLGERALAIRR